MNLSYFLLGNGCIEGKELEHFIRELEIARKSVVSYTLCVFVNYGKNIRCSCKRWSECHIQLL